MGQMHERISAWRDGEGYRTEVIGGKMLPPHHFMEGRVALTDAGPRTEVRFTLRYKLRFGLLGRAMDALLVRPQFKAAPGKYVAGLKAYAEISQRI